MNNVQSEIFEVLTAVLMRIIFTWHMTSCGFVREDGGNLLL